MLYNWQSKTLTEQDQDGEKLASVLGIRHTTTLEKVLVVQF